MSRCFIKICSRGADFIIDHEDKGLVKTCSYHTSIIVTEAEIGEVVRCV